jgi:beta-glucosidase
VQGSEIAQLYLAFPEKAKSPAKQLRGFEKVTLKPGQSKTVEFVLQRRDVSVWDTKNQAWKIESGNYNVLLGKSSRDIVGEKTFTLST